jgi:hypothetical protein
MRKAITALAAIVTIIVAGSLVGKADATTVTGLGSLLPLTTNSSPVAGVACWCGQYPCACRGPVRGAVRGTARATATVGKGVVKGTAIAGRGVVVGTGRATVGVARGRRSQLVIPDTVLCRVVRLQFRLPIGKHRSGLYRPPALTSN